MAWWVGAAIQAAPFVYNAIVGSSTQKEQANLNSEYALANSIAINQAGEVNASSILAMGSFNSSAALATARVENTKIQAVTDYNSGRTMAIADYNSQLLEQDALLVLEQSDLDIQQLKRQHEKALGRVEVSYAASGAIAGQDSAKLAVQDAKEQMDTEQMVVRRGADVQYRKLLNQAALSRFAGLEEANKMQLEARLLASTSSTNAALKAAGISTQAGIDANATTYNASVQASQALQSGMLASDKANDAADSAMWSNMFMAGTTLAGSYLDNKAKVDASNKLSSLLTT